MNKLFWMGLTTMFVLGAWTAATANMAPFDPDERRHPPDSGQPPAEKGERHRGKKAPPQGKQAQKDQGKPAEPPLR